MPEDIKVTRDDVVDRCLHACQKPIRYGMGKGGMNPQADYPDSGGLLDCSGFAAWAWGMSRYQPNTGMTWIETTAIFNDAKGKHVRFKQVSVPQPGDCYVYGDSPTGSAGHVGVVTSVKNGVPLKIAHCNARTHPALVNENFSTWWKSNGPKHGAIYAQFQGLVEEVEEDVDPTTVIVEGVKSTGYFDAEAGLNYLTIASIKQILTREGYPYTWDKAKLTLVIGPKNAAGVYSTDSDDESA